MSIPPFVLGYPQDGSSLGSTKTQIRNNLDGTFETLSVDHQNQNQTNPGYHSVVHWKTQSGNPSTVSNITQEFTKTDANSIQQKWLFSTGGNAYQQTRMIDGNISSFANVAGAGLSGWTYLPGGMLMQWGKVVTDFTISNATVNFPVDFTSNVFNIQTTLTGNSGTANIVQINALLGPAPPYTGFRWISTNGSPTSYTGFFWLAIGV